jgi:Ca2+-binding RTX toxin-like protein
MSYQLSQAELTDRLSEFDLAIENQIIRGLEESGAFGPSYTSTLATEFLAESDVPRDGTELAIYTHAAESVEVPSAVPNVILATHEDVEVKVTSGALKLLASGGGDDRLDLKGSGATIVLSGGGSDTVSSGSGDDTLYGGSHDDVLLGEAGDDLIDGEDGHDTLMGGSGNDTLAGGAGDDQISGGGGRDALSGGDGNDILWGAGGDDTLTGGEGHDTLDGGGGNDVLAGGTGNDLHLGGGGNDVFLIGRSDGNDTVVGGGGYDVVHLVDRSAEERAGIEVDSASDRITITFGDQSIELHGIARIIFTDGDTIL